MTVDALPPDDSEFWEELVALYLQMVCTIERYRLNRRYTTAELRKMGKEAAANRDRSRNDCNSDKPKLALSDDV